MADNKTKILEANGLTNGAAIVAAAERSGQELAIVAALAERESGGRNLFGGDVGGVFSTTPRTEVTPARFARFLVAVFVDKEKSNGVGLAQITWPPSIARGIREGYDLADPADNMTFGATLLGELLATEGVTLAEAGTLYNTGTLKNGVNEYGRRLAAGADAWRARLNETKETDPSMSTNTKDRLAEVAAWGASILGKSVDVDGYPAFQPYQCVDVSKHYAKFVHGAPLAPYGNGKDVAANLSRLPGWQWIPATSRGQAGDVVSWGAPFGVSDAGVEYGHTAVLAADDDGGRLDVFQADGFTAGAKVYRAKNGRNGLRGFARPPRYVAPEVAAERPGAVGTAGTTYTVRAGDTLWRLSLILGTTVARLKALNPGVDPNSLKVGQVLTVAAEAPKTHTVKAGESPWSISQQYGISLARFYALNGTGGLHPNDVVKVSA